MENKLPKRDKSGRFLPMKKVDDNETVLILRTCASDMSSRNNFIWPRSGPVECPDWEPTKECGNGLHGFLWGEGEGGLADWSNDAVWLVVEVLEKDVINIDNDKAKFPRGNVVYAGDRKTATDMIYARCPRAAIIGAMVTVGDKQYVRVGYKGTASAGDGGIASAGRVGTATAGEGGIASAGEGGIASAGYRGTATAGYGGTASAGWLGIISIKHYDCKNNRYRLATGYIGENGLEPNVKYRVDDDGMFVKAE